jgi:hypothetical protein
LIPCHGERTIRERVADPNLKRARMNQGARHSSLARRLARGVLVLGAACVLSGCVATSALKKPGLAAPATPGTRVLLMTPDVQLSEMTAGGLEEPNAAWTEQGRRNVTAALARFMSSRRARMISYREPQEGSPAARAHVQLQKLHEVVGGTILLHKYNQAAVLPTKVDTFDWTLGAQTAQLGDEFGADYGLFVLLHDSYASGERVAVIVAAALFGVGLHGGIQRGFASLVDLRTGDIVWFNVLVRGAGDLRDAGSADDAVTTLLSDVPL